MLVEIVYTLDSTGMTKDVCCQLELDNLLYYHTSKLENSVRTALGIDDTTYLKIWLIQAVTRQDKIKKLL